MTDAFLEAVGLTNLAKIMQSLVPQLSDLNDQGPTTAAAYSPASSSLFASTPLAGTTFNAQSLFFQGQRV